MTTSIVSVEEVAIAAVVIAVMVSITTMMDLNLCLLSLSSLSWLSVFVLHTCVLWLYLMNI